MMIGSFARHYIIVVSGKPALGPLKGNAFQKLSTTFQPQEFLEDWFGLAQGAPQIARPHTQHFAAGPRQM